MLLRVLALAILVLAVASWLTGAPRLRRALWAALVLVAAYGVLKATGVIDAMAPPRLGYLYTLFLTA